MATKKLVKFFIFAGDVAVIFAALFFALLIRNRDLVSQFYTFLQYSWILYAFWLCIIFLLNLYDLHFFKKPLDFYFNVIIFSLFAALSGMAYFYLRPEFGITPKTILLLNIFLFDCLFILWRWVVNAILESKGVKEKIVIVGSTPALEEILSQLKKNYDVSGFFSGVEGLRDLIARERVSSVILAAADNKLVQEIFYQLPLTLNYIDFNDLYEQITKRIPLKYINEAWFLEKISKTENKFEETIKRILDIIFSSLGMAIFLIFYPIISLFIKWDSNGPIFYRQERVGKNGKIFLLTKFRTMQYNDFRNEDAWQRRNNHSVTRVGKVLRRMHLDELPQAWSILKGDMSFVGPRPEWVDLYKRFEKEVPFYNQRHLVKPGLFGWAQINYGAPSSIDEVGQKFQYDLYYIKNKSLLLDLEIILKAIKLFLF